MGKKAPSAPDPYKTAQAQMNTNAINQTGPFGTSKFQKDSSGNVTGIDTQFNSELGGLASSLQGTGQTQAGFLPGSKFQLFGPETQAASQQYFDRGAALLADPFKQARNELDVRLTERGLPIGSEARNVAEGNLGRQQSLALSDLAAQGALKAPELAAFENEQNYSNLARTLQNLNAIPMPTQANQPQADVAGLVSQDYQNKLNQYNNKQAGLGSLLKTAAGIAFAPATGGLSGTLIGSTFLK